MSSRVPKWIRDYPLVRHDTSHDRAVYDGTCARCGAFGSAYYRTTMDNWRCGRCGRIFSSEELIGFSPRMEASRIRRLVASAIRKYREAKEKESLAYERLMKTLTAVDEFMKRRRTPKKR